MITLPQRIFFTGVPGSRWSGVAQIMETSSDFNISDRTPEREYKFQDFSSHLGSYFGSGMEFSSDLTTLQQQVDMPWQTISGCKIVKSHDWAYNLPRLKEMFPDDWIMLVYRPDVVSFAWWHGAGGFNISYPEYAWYKDSQTMMNEIANQNKLILEYGYKMDATWNHLTSKWLVDNFGGTEYDVPAKFHDMLVTIIK